MKKNTTKTVVIILAILVVITALAIIVYNTQFGRNFILGGKKDPNDGYQVGDRDERDVQTNNNATPEPIKVPETPEPTPEPPADLGNYDPKGIDLGGYVAEYTGIKTSKDELVQILKDTINWTADFLEDELTGDPKIYQRQQLLKNVFDALEKDGPKAKPSYEYKIGVYEHELPNGQKVESDQIDTINVDDWIKDSFYVSDYIRVLGYDAFEKITMKKTESFHFGNRGFGYTDNNKFVHMFIDGIYKLDTNKISAERAWLFGIFNEEMDDYPINYKLMFEVDGKLYLAAFTNRGGYVVLDVIAMDSQYNFNGLNTAVDPENPNPPYEPKDPESNPGTNYPGTETNGQQTISTPVNTPAPDGSFYGGDGSGTITPIESPAPTPEQPAWTPPPYSEPDPLPSVPPQNPGNADFITIEPWEPNPGMVNDPFTY